MRKVENWHLLTNTKDFDEFIAGIRHFQRYDAQEPDEYPVMAIACVGNVDLFVLFLTREDANMINNAFITENYERIKYASHDY